MEDIKLRLSTVVAGKLSAAPDSDTKSELIEELSDNLHRRYLDMTGAGVPEEEAFQRAVDDLGDVDELLAYLGVETQNTRVVIDRGMDGQTSIQTGDGKTIIVNNNGDGSRRVVINSPENSQEHTLVYGPEYSGDMVINMDEQETPTVIHIGGSPVAGEAREEPEAARQQAEDAQKRAEAAREQAGTARQQAEDAPQKETKTSFEGDLHYGYQPEGSTDGHGDVHYDYSGQGPQSDLDAILAGVSEACNTAIDQAKEALRQAREAMKRRTTVQRDNGRVKVHFNTHAPTPPTPPAPPTAPVPPTPPEGWQFEAELDSDEGRFFAGAGPSERKDVVYGFGYDKAKGGFYTQWGEWKGEAAPEDRTGRGPMFHGVDTWVEHQDDGSYSVAALKDLRGISVHTNAGDVSIHVSEAPTAGVIIDGDVDDLDVTCTADGILTIREGRTASSSFFSRRGIGSADVELFLPARHWEMIHVTTASGDVDIDRNGLDIGELTVQTGSGDLSALLSACKQLHFKSGSGDLEVEGTCDSLYAETMSGDVSLHSWFDEAVVKTASGDVELDNNCARLHVETISGDIQIEGQMEDALLRSKSGEIEVEGSAAQLVASSVSGDVSLETRVMPQVMELSSKSGDCQASIPDAGPFSARMMTTSGEIDCQFPMQYADGMFVYGDGSGPAYSLTTVSGSVALERI